MARYHGKRGRLYASVSGTTTAVPVASLSNWTLDMKADRVDVTSFEDTNKTTVLGFPDISGTFAGNWDDTETTLMTARSSADGTRLYLYPSLDAPSKVASGAAWVDVSITDGVDGKVAVSGTFSARGSWTVSL